MAFFPYIGKVSHEIGKVLRNNLFSINETPIGDKGASVKVCLDEHQRCLRYGVPIQLVDAEYQQTAPQIMLIKAP